MIDLTNIQLPHSTQFAEKWKEWVDYRKELKKPYKTQKGVTGALNQLGAVTEQEAIAMIDSSMRNEYQGLFEKKKEKGETPKVYIVPKPKELSNHQPTNTPTEEERKEFIIGKIKSAYEGKINLNDVGSVYSNRLQPFLFTPNEVMEQIHAKVTERANRKPKNRFEELPEINVELELRNEIIKHNMGVWQSESREIYKEI